MYVFKVKISVRIQFLVMFIAVSALVITALASDITKPERFIYIFMFIIAAIFTFNVWISKISIASDTISAFNIFGTKSLILQDVVDIQSTEQRGRINYILIADTNFLVISSLYDNLEKMTTLIKNGIPTVICDSLDHFTSDDLKRANFRLTLILITVTIISLTSCIYIF